MTSREAVFAALFAQLQTATGFVTFGRAVKPFESIGAADQPACFVEEGNQAAVAGFRVPVRWTYKADVVVYVSSATQGQTMDASAGVVTPLNAQIDAVVAALAPSPATQTQTLGGLVEDVRISGEVEVFTGRLNAGGAQGIALIPVEIIANV